MVKHRTLELRRTPRAGPGGRAKSQFVSNVSHELRTPITNIRLCTSIWPTAARRSAIKATSRRSRARPRASNTWWRAC